MYRKPLIILFLCCLFFPGRLQAQITEDQTPHWAVSVSPYYLLNGGLGLNLEKKIRPNHWVELNLTGYHLSRPDKQTIRTFFGIYNSYDGFLVPNADFDYISGLSGLGVGTTYKYYFFRNFMVHTAFSYNWYDVKYTSYNYSPYTEDGLTYYEYMWGDVHQSFHKLRLLVAVGVRSAFKRALFAEPYVGLGCTYSFYDENKRAYNETVFGYGYRGLYLTTGIKIGFNLCKK